MDHYTQVAKLAIVAFKHTISNQLVLTKWLFTILLAAVNILLHYGIIYSRFT